MPFHFEPMARALVLMRTRPIDLARAFGGAWERSVTRVTWETLLRATSQLVHSFFFLVLMSTGIYSFLVLIPNL